MRRRIAQTQPIGAALRASDTFVQLTTLVGALEELSPQGVTRRSEYLSYRVARVRYPKALRGRAAELLFSPKVERTVSAMKLVSSALLLVLGPKTPLARTVRVAQVSAHAYGHLRVAGYGQDGSDHALAVLHGAQLVAAFSKPSSHAERTAFDFVAAQGILSYFVSGFAKLVSPVWRSGVAMPAIMRATTYGDEKLYKAFRDYPALAKAVAWGTIVGETAAPITLVAPTPVRYAWQLGMLGMHAGIARYMGLNRFMWAFVAFHPVLAVFTRERSRSVAAALRQRFGHKA